ncbi:HhH-GPD family protein [Gloeomargarita lithophora Alchichica-D10]|uniref:DNA-3-methyladenine glycosylase II n=1 Tax=Gloeomargarita lithophora Alchichica-D10 TaxID=1188229 RepID=A0A1J0AGH8_9CYAN|nr:DNA-3-methyladenine glycosylase [Gloeomargarita lithophora]APB35023.1 HhH-GPD family protein [Gloeomargarita lithophora Alchichica-D10]
MRRQETHRHPPHDNRTIITLETLAQGLSALNRQDQVLAQVYAQVQTPPLWLRTPGLATLVQIILEQQVSLKSAQATFNRLQNICQPLSAPGLLKLTADEWRTCGVSRQKSTYLCHLATALETNTLDLEILTALDDAIVHQQLTQICGIGTWTANIYLLMALGRPDVWPTGDLALVVSIKNLYQLPDKITTKELDKLTETWRPWRAVAARLLWQYYLKYLR